MTPPPAPRHHDRLSAVVASRWALPALAIAAFGVSLWVQHAIYPSLSWNRDEPVYLWQVEVLRAGQLTASDGGFPRLFLPWLSAAREGAVFSQYTLGWPLVLLAGAVLGSPGLGVAAGAALCVVGTWALVRELLDDRAVATVAASLVVASPFFAVQSGVHLSYLFTLGLGLLFLASSFSGVRLRHPPRLVGAGALLGWIVLTRPFDAVVWALLAAVPLAMEHRRSIGATVKLGMWVALGALPFVAGTLWVNRQLTGSFTQFPITAADPLDTFGFGDRRLMPGFAPLEYGPRLATTSVARNLFWLPFFLVGAHLGVVVALRAAWTARGDRAVQILIGLGVAFPLAYAAFFGTHISSLTARLSSPIYYLPTYVPLCALLALALVRLARQRLRTAILVSLGLVLITAPIAVSRLEINRSLSRANEPWADSVADLDEQALIITSPDAYLLYLNPFGHNGPDLDGRLLYASDRGPEVIRLLQAHPDRVPYLQRASLSVPDLQPSGRPEVPAVTLTPMRLVTGDVRLTGRLRHPSGTNDAVWWVAVDGQVAASPRPVDASTTEIRVQDLRLADGLHTIDVMVGIASGSPTLRQRFYASVNGAGTSVLSPGTSARFGPVEGRPHPEWVDALHLDDLQLTVST